MELVQSGGRAEWRSRKERLRESPFGGLGVGNGGHLNRDWVKNTFRKEMACLKLLGW